MDINKIKQNLILSVGIHRKKRILTPVEVAEGIKVLKDNDMATKDIRDLLMLTNDSMITKFERLLSLSPEIRYLIDWGQTPSSIPFSSAAEISRLLDEGEQKLVADALLENSLTKNEIIQIIQARLRSSKTINECIDETIKLRPQIDHKFVYIGAILDNDIKIFLQSLTQFERDTLLNNVINQIIPEKIPWDGRLGIERFTIVGSKYFSTIIESLENGFENNINSLLIEIVRAENE